MLFCLKQALGLQISKNAEVILSTIDCLRCCRRASTLCIMQLPFANVGAEEKEESSCDNVIKNETMCQLHPLVTLKKLIPADYCHRVI